MLRRIALFMAVIPVAAHAVDLKGTVASCSTVASFDRCIDTIDFSQDKSVEPWMNKCKAMPQGEARAQCYRDTLEQLGFTFLQPGKAVSTDTKPNSVQGVGGKIKIISQPAEIIDDEFKKNLTIHGLSVLDETSTYYSLSFRYFLRSFVLKADSTRSHQLYVVARYTGDWLFWRNARSEATDEMKFLQIDQDSSCYSSVCIHTEDFAIPLDERMLVAKAASGMKIKLYSKRGESAVITILPRQIEEQLKTVEGVSLREALKRQ